ncbi:hypothetical protein DSO57_1017717 [Entomophthora muscae]|uniref:Uncharacterized protein n=1 Tax=Entomophthora muscae TaxID=34485 RepID=A0ACC2STK9_9FUNG|nr:hypothetical protein DSO57_1017717 [Entomophthora muscae]
MPLHWSRLGRTWPFCNAFWGKHHTTAHFQFSIQQWGYFILLRPPKPPTSLCVPPTPVDTPQAPRETGPARSSCTNFFDQSHRKESPPHHCPQDRTPTQFKPTNLPKFDPKGNVHTFLLLFEMSMYGANNQDKATTLLNQLDAASTNLIILHIPKHNWLYAAAKNVLLYKFGSIAWVTERKNEFLMISFRKDNTISEFANCFYIEAQILTGSGLLTVHDAHIALWAAVKPYKALYQTLMPTLLGNFTLDGMVHYLRQCGDTFRPPQHWIKAPPSLQLPRTLGGSHQQQIPVKTQYH